jgi:hypothetical protein
MTIKKRLNAIVNGWIPEESTLPVCNQTVKHNRWQPIRHYLFPLVVGVTFGGLFALLHPFLNLAAWLGTYVWPVIIVLYAGIVSVAVFAWMKQKHKQKTVMEPKS